MKNKLFIIAALFALILTGCAKENLETEIEAKPEAQTKAGPKKVTVSVTMTSPVDNATRVTFSPDSETPHGLIFRWEETDKLLLCYEYNDGTITHYYHGDGAIKPESISEDGKTADFDCIIPSDIPTDATFNFYAVYQKTNSDDADGGCFQPNTKIYDLEMHESICIRLDNGGGQRGIVRPMLYYSKTNIINTESPALGSIKLQHAGWIMAIHLKNNTGAEMNLPAFIILASVYFNYVSNGDGDNSISTTSFDFSDNTFSTGSSDLKNIFLSINKDGNPLSGHKLKADESIIFYRWVATNTTIPKLLGAISFSGDDVDQITSTLLPPKTITFGKVYHIYTTWDGSKFEFSARY